MSIVGVWEVFAHGAPFGFHVMTFHADGTLAQSNPDLGNRVTSDSNDRSDPRRVRRGVVRLEVSVTGDTFTGSSYAVFSDIGGEVSREPVSAGTHRSAVYGR